MSLQKNKLALFVALAMGSMAISGAAQAASVTISTEQDLYENGYDAAENEFDITIGSGSNNVLNVDGLEYDGLGVYLHTSEGDCDSNQSAQNNQLNITSSTVNHIFAVSASAEDPNHFH